jgi:hypothetical protein
VRVTSLRALSLGLLLSALQACVAGGPQGVQLAREPVRWILVERRYGDIAGVEEAGVDRADGQVDPDATVLAFQPLYPEDLTWEVVVSPEEHFVELLGFSPSGPVAPGEVVSATVRVGKAKVGQRYRLLAKPSQPDVRILGDHKSVVNGEAAAVFRFTRSRSGRAGISVGVERLLAEEDMVP